MSMGTTRDDGSHQSMWVATADLPRGGGHPFFERLNRILDAAGFDAFVEGLCAPFYARMGRPSLAPGRYFRLLLIGYFEGLDSERAIAWRTDDSLSLRSFLRLAPPASPPDHSTISRNLGLLLRQVTGVGTPRSPQGRAVGLFCALVRRFCDLWSSLGRLWAVFLQFRRGRPLHGASNASVHPYNRRDFHLRLLAPTDSADEANFSCCLESLPPQFPPRGRSFSIRAYGARCHCVLHTLSAAWHPSTGRSAGSPGSCRGATEGTDRS